MATNRWSGGAAAISQVNTLTVGGTAANGQVYTVTMNGKTVTYTATGTDTNTTIATNLLTNLTATTTSPEFQEVTWANPSAGVITGTATIAGVPFVQTSSATGTGTFTTSTTTASSGPNDASIAANWSTGTLPATGDSIYLQNSSVSMLYGLSALSAITPALYQQDASFTGDVGLPYQNNNGYTEYRPRFLQFTGCTTINIGQGLGNGSGKTQLDLQSGNYTANVWDTASSSSETNVPCVVLKGGAGSTTVNVYKGSVGIALFAGETATVPNLNLGYVSNVTGDAQVTVGAGCTLTTVTKTGGSLYSTAAVLTLTSYAGTSTILAGNMTTASLKRNSNGAVNVLNYEPAAGGTITTNTLESGCKLDCSGTLGTVTLTNSTWYAGATVNAPASNVTMSNAASIPDGQASDVNVNLGPGRTLLVA